MNELFRGSPGDRLLSSQVDSPDGYLLFTVPGAFPFERLQRAHMRGFFFMGMFRTLRPHSLLKRS